MEEITIKYWSPHGRQEETKFQCDNTKIDFVMRAAQRIDLSDLSRCYNLETLDLSHNMLEELNLSPLSMCSTIKEINLEGNHLKTLDLWPLRENIKLAYLNVSDNRLQRLDLTSLIQHVCTRIDSSVVISVDNILRFVYTRNEISKRFEVVRTDGISWSIPPVIMWHLYSEMKENYRWAQIKERIFLALSQMESIHWYGAQRGLLQGLNLAFIGGYDGDPHLLLANAAVEMSFDEARQAIFDTTVKLVQEQLEESGPTLFFDVEGMKNTSASKLIPLIVDRRQEEIETLSLPVKGSKVDLRPLWLTQYGFNILDAADMRFTTDIEGLENLRSSFNEIGLDLETKKVSSIPEYCASNYSESMQKHIFDFVREKELIDQMIQDVI